MYKVYYCTLCDTCVNCLIICFRFFFSLKQIKVGIKRVPDGTIAIMLEGIPHARLTSGRIINGITDDRATP